MAKVTQILQRSDGSEIKLVAESMYGLGLTRSIGIYAWRRGSGNHEWSLLGDRPHPKWRSMSIEEYVERGRRQMFYFVSFIEIMEMVRHLNELEEI